MNTMAAYNDLVQRELADLDIGIVCLNAGILIEGPSDLVSDSDFERVFTLNGLGVVYFAKAILPLLMKRKQRSNILITSSILSYISIPTVSSYCATKALISNFATSLHYEVKEWIDVTLWEPGPTKTKIFEEGVCEGTEPPPDSQMLTCEKAVSGVLRQLGRARTNGNYWFHF